jgi:hypothetical protein
MSQYRDDRGAARLRIEALEARVAEREADLARCGSALAARDEEILRLQRELELAGGLGPRHMRSVSAAWASRTVGAASGLALLAAGAGVVLMRGGSAVAPPPAVVEEVAEVAPIHADPLVTGPVDWSAAPAEGPKATVARMAPPGEAPIVRRVEPRVWGGRASQDEHRMLKSLCFEGDTACRERARDALERARDLDP